MKTPSRTVFGSGSFSECSDDVRSTDLGRKGGGYSARNQLFTSENNSAKLKDPSLLDASSVQCSESKISTRF